MNWSRGSGFAGVFLILMFMADGIPGQTLDDELLDGLRGNPLDAELGRSLFGPGEADESGQESAKRVEPGPLDLRERLRSAAANEASPSPALSVARDMREVQARLSQANWDAKTQSMQAKILADLDDLIEQAARRCQQCQGTSPGSPQGGQTGNTPGEPGVGETNNSEAPTDAGTKTADNEATGQIGDVLKRVWGELPDVERQRVLQAMGEEFLPRYRALIESYYRRLAEEVP